MDANLESNSEIAEDSLAGGGAVRDAEPAQAFASASSAPWANFREQAFSTRAPAPKPKRKADPFVLGAGMSAVGLVAIALVAIGGLAAYEFLYQSVELSAKTRQVDEIASRMTVLEDRVDSIQAAQRHEQTGEPQAVLGELKGNDQSTREVGNAIAEPISPTSRRGWRNSRKRQRRRSRSSHSRRPRRRRVRARARRTRHQSPKSPLRSKILRTSCAVLRSRICRTGWRRSKAPTAPCPFPPATPSPELAGF
jgi:type II secretory pathway component PulJ